MLKKKKPKARVESTVITIWMYACMSWILVWRKFVPDGCGSILGDYRYSRFDYNLKTRISYLQGMSLVLLPWGFPYRCLTEGQFRTAETGLSIVTLYHKIAQTHQPFARGWETFALFQRLPLQDGRMKICLLRWLTHFMKDIRLVLSGVKNFILFFPWIGHPFRR